MIINDSMYLLDEVLTKLPEVREVEAMMDNKDQWNALDQVCISRLPILSMYSLHL